MARIRTVKPSFFRSRTINRLSYAQRLTFIGLWTHCDDEGRCEFDSELIKADVWPRGDRSVSDVEDDIRALTEHSLLVHYKVDERSYLQVRNWGEHQKINRPTPSAIPAYELGQIVPLTSSSEEASSSHGTVTEDSLPERKGREGNKEGKGTDSLRSSGAVAPSDVNPGTVVAAWVEAFMAPEGRQRPSEPMRKQVGNEARKVLGGDKPRPDLLLEAARLAGAKGYPTLEREYAPLLAGPKVNGHPSNLKAWVEQ